VGTGDRRLDEFQFAESSMPTPMRSTQLLQTHLGREPLYDEDLLKRGGVARVGLDKNAPDFPAGEVSVIATEVSQGLLMPTPNANILYSTLARRPKALPRRFSSIRTRLFFRELIDSDHRRSTPGRIQNYPDDYGVGTNCHRQWRAVDSTRIQPLHQEAPRSRNWRTFRTGPK